MGSTGAGGQARPVPGVGGVMFGPSRNAVSQARQVLYEQAASFGSAGGRVVGTLGPIGGVGKTSLAAMLAVFMSEGLDSCIVEDCNPLESLLRQRLLGGTGQGRLLEFLDGLDQIRTPMDLAGFLDSVGRVHLLHHDGVDSAVVENQITQQQWSAGLVKLRGFAQLVIADGGNSHHFTASRAMLAQLDHLVVCMRLDLSVYNKTAKMMQELHRGGYADLIAGATLVICQADAKQGMTPLLVQGIDSLTRMVGAVVTIPYDHAAGSVGQLKFAALKPATQLAYLDAATHVAQVFTRPPRHHAAAAAEAAAEVSPGPVAPGLRGLPPVRIGDVESAS